MLIIAPYSALRNRYCTKTHCSPGPGQLPPPPLFVRLQSRRMKKRLEEKKQITSKGPRKLPLLPSPPSQNHHHDHQQQHHDHPTPKTKLGKKTPRPQLRKPRERRSASCRAPPRAKPPSSSLRPTPFFHPLPAYPTSPSAGVAGGGADSGGCY